MQKMGIFPSHFIVLCLCSISTHFKVWICDLFFFAFRNKAKAFICVFIFLLFAILYWLPLQVSHPALPSAICAKPEGIGTKWNLVLFDRTRDNKQATKQKILISYYGRKKPSIHRGYEISILGDQLHVALNSPIKGSPVPFWVWGQNQTTTQPKLCQEYN